MVADQAVEIEISSSALLVTQGFSSCHFLLIGEPNSAVKPGAVVVAHPTDNIAAIGVGEHDEIIDILMLNKCVQLVGQTTRGGLIPHVLIEITVDTFPGPIIRCGIGLITGAMDN
ncbi:3-deoxy-7-phosphoheptulonate synthase [Shewanella benthica KT99]|uniref:3-deoxy-7-phosphoheptulonate synthase n=1 Tax=Shewanella benthica KT99 TaxID=314608 RepID=A9D709_9GAMM|nr:3-deoxy-7-phosphoheptulonate synthase [Shewanella benthica KT99]